MDVRRFPRQNAECMPTAAYHAERELDTLLYQDTGMYRDEQYQKAVSLTLQSIYEEISILVECRIKIQARF